MSRLKKLKDEMPESLDEKTRAEIQTKIDTARIQIGAALLADGTDPRASQIIDDVFTTSPTDELDGVWTSHPFLTAEILADMVSQFAVEVGQISEEHASTLLTLINKASERIDERYAKGEFEAREHAYLSGMMHKLAGQVLALSGMREGAADNLVKAAEQLQIVLNELSGTPDQLSEARIRGYLGEAQLIQASLHDADDAQPLLDASTESFSAALSAIAPDVAPRDAARLRHMLATAELTRAEWYVDAGALERAIDNMERARRLLAANQRPETAGVTVHLTSLLFSDAIFRAGVPSAEKGLALLDDLGAQGRAPQAAAIDHARCLVHLAAGARFDPGGETLSEEALEHLAQSRKACEAAAAALMEIDNIVGWAQVNLALADGLRLSGERTEDPAQLEAALKIVETVQDKLADVDIPPLKAELALIGAGAARELGVLTRDAGLLQKAIDQELAARNVFAGKEFAVQRIQADAELARSLTALSKLQETDDGLDEAIELLSSVKDRYAAGGATLAAKDVARDLEKAQALRAELAAN